MFGRSAFVVFVSLTLLVVNSASAEIVAQWRLDGDVTDHIGNNDGTLFDGARFMADAIRGTVLSVDGAGAHAEIPHSATIGFIDDTTLSLTMWARPASLPRTSWTTVVAKNRDIHYNEAYGLWISPENAWHFRVGNTSGNANVAGAPSPTEEWQHLAMTHDPSTTTMRGYVNGELIYENTGANPQGLGDSALWLGGAGGVTEFYPGLLDDVRLYNHALTSEEVLLSMQDLEEAELASQPSPEEAALDVPRDVTLAWSPGEYAQIHDVYLGTTFDDVNDASRANPAGVLVSQGQPDVSYAPPSVLEFDRTYYWRVDEVNAPPDSTIFKGTVWSFTVEPLAYAIDHVLATSNGSSDAGAGPENTVNGSGLNANDEHSIDATDMWLVAVPPANPLWVQYEFDRVYKLHEMLVWNYNVQFELVLGFGVKDVTVEYSTDGIDWAVLGDVELARATATSTYAANTTIAFEGIAARFVRLTVNSGWGPMDQFGLSEVRFLQIPAHARSPQPADAETAVNADTMLRWRAGREAASHQVYLSTDEAAVAEKTALIDSVSTNSYAPTNLNLGTTYYWKIDEVNEAEAVSTWEGDIWSFSTQEYALVDDFESYNDEDNRVYDTWIDGWVNETGSTVGHLEEPFAETGIVHTGRQSMPLFYDNANVATSEAELALTQDWTAHGIKSLSVYLRGAATNNGGQLYVTINDTKVPYDGDASDINRAVWQPWSIDLAALGVNLQSVTKLIIGIEGAGAQGIVYIDDIRLYPDMPQIIAPTEPDSAALVAHYALDGNANDSSGNGYDGTEIDGVSYVAGIDGQGVQLDGLYDYIDFGTPAGWPAGLEPRTMTGWGLTETIDASWRWMAAYGTGATSQAMFIGLNGPDLYGGGHGDDVMLTNFWTVGEWHHIGLTYDGITARLYADGVEVAAEPKNWNLVPDRAHIGRQVSDQIEFWMGVVDEVRLYNQALSAGEIAWLAGKRAPVHQPF